MDIRIIWIIDVFTLSFGLFSQGVIGLETEYGTLHVKVSCCSFTADTLGWFLQIQKSYYFWLKLSVTLEYSCDRIPISNIFQLLPDCAPRSVFYILELLSLRHCAGCHFYRAEGRGEFWDAEGNHVKNVRLNLCVCIYFATIAQSGSLWDLYAGKNSARLLCMGHPNAIPLFPANLLMRPLMLSVVSGHLNSHLGPTRSPFCTDPRNPRGSRDQIQDDPNWSLPDDKEGNRRLGRLRPRVLHKPSESPGVEQGLHRLRLSSCWRHGHRGKDCSAPNQSRCLEQH